MTKKKSADDQNLGSPVDLYVRHSLAKDIIDNVFRGPKDKSLKILDVGGYKGKTQSFLPKDRVEVLDVYDVNESNYIKGDATKMSFADGAYDIVTSFDVLEHIPRAKRKAFISEKARVAKTGVIMTLPVDTSKGGPTSRAEVKLNDFFLKISGEEHPWLKEHIEYSIPLIEEVESLLKDTNLRYELFFSNDIDAWKLVQAINFSAAVCEEGLSAAKRVNAEYNRNMHLMEPVKENGYRAIVVITKASSAHSKLKSYSKAILKNDNSKDALDIGLNAALDLLAILIKEKKNLAEKQQKLANDLSQREQRIEQLESEINTIKQSRTWKLAVQMKSVAARTKMKRN